MEGEVCPTPSPTSTPSMAPTVCRGPANVCISIDMSGSVCSSNPSRPQTCSNCSCRRSPFPDRRTCCPNFAAIKKFTVDVIERIDSEQFRRGNTSVRDKEFSLVRFSDSGSRLASLTEGPVAIDVATNLEYTGGRTNHVDALNFCQNTLDPGQDPPDFILLVTDGVPNRPFGSSRQQALRAATRIKDEGTVIETLFIGRNTNQGTIKYMKDLSSDNTVRNIDDFAQLAQIVDDIAFKIACGAAPSP